MRVDSALETSTNTSASIQCLVIHSSILGFISIPGLCPQGVGGGGGVGGGREGGGEGGGGGREGGEGGRGGGREGGGGGREGER